VPAREAALASALGEYFERLHQLLLRRLLSGEQVANGDFVHYPNEKWFPIEGDQLPAGLLDSFTRKFYNPDGEVTADMLVDLQSGNEERGIVALPFERQSDHQTVYIPMNIIGNLYVSNGMSAGNTGPRPAPRGCRRCSSAT
jgi:ribosomal protein S12 methylthiotransferase accessory factor